jgi:transcription antitermination factor NusG
MRVDTLTHKEIDRPGPPVGKRWFVAQTLARREPLAALRLQAQGYEIFLPQMVKTVRHARKTRTVQVAVFPGYIFVALDLARDRWRSINGTIHVSRIITGETYPIPVPVKVIDALMSYQDENGICRFDKDLKPGEKVRVVAGPFAEIVGRIASLDDKGRARILLEILGGEVMTTLDRSALERT